MNTQQIIDGYKVSTMIHENGHEMPVQVNERRRMLLRPTTATEPRGEWLARHWRECGYQTIDGVPITAESVCTALD